MNLWHRIVRALKCWSIGPYCPWQPDSEESCAYCGRCGGEK